MLLGLTLSLGPPSVLYISCIYMLQCLCYIYSILFSSAADGRFSFSSMSAAESFLFPLTQNHGFNLCYFACPKIQSYVAWAPVV